MTVREPLATGEFSVVRLPVEIDLANRSEILTSLLEAIDNGGAHLVVDGRDVCFIDSSGLYALVRACERTAATGGSFHIVAASRRVRRLVELSGLEKMLRRVGSIEEAVACITSTAGAHVCSDNHAKVEVPSQH